MVIYVIACACGAFCIVFINKNCFGLNMYCYNPRQARDVTPATSLTAFV
jgi:hypothetical protein